MNKKHKLLHRDNEYITSKLEIIYEEDIQRIVEEKNNLQSKIDKANEILNRPQFEYDNIPCNYEEDIKELKDVLKEDK
jgi:hypothetical protein